MSGDPVVDPGRRALPGVGLVSTRLGERMLRVVEVVAQRGARLGLPPVGTRKRGDAIAEPVETETVVDREVDAARPLGHRRDESPRCRRSTSAPIAARTPATRLASSAGTPSARSVCRFARDRRRVGTDHEIGQPGRRLSATGSRNRVTVASEVEVDRMADQPPGAAFDEPARGEEHPVLRRRRDEEVERVDRGPRARRSRTRRGRRCAPARAPGGWCRSRRPDATGS